MDVLWAMDVDTVWLDTQATYFEIKIHSIYELNFQSVTE